MYTQKGKKQAINKEMKKKKIFTESQFQTENKMEEPNHYSKCLKEDR